MSGSFGREREGTWDLLGFAHGSRGSAIVVGASGLWLLAGAWIGFIWRDWAWRREYEPLAQGCWDGQNNGPRTCS